MKILITGKDNQVRQEMVSFLVLSDYADLLYKTTNYLFPEHERVLLWNSKELNINWPV